jgi:hypothetical protein
MDTERSLREFFEKEAEPIGAPAGMGVTVMRRARVRRVVTGVAAVGLVASLGVLSFVDIDLVSRDGGRAPVGPAGGGRDSGEADGFGLEGKVVLDAGVIDGQTWELIARRSRQGLCVEIEFSNGSSGSCGLEDEDLNASLDYHDSLDHLFYLGTLSPRVANLELRYNDGRIESVRIIDHEDFETRFFVAFVPIGADGELAAFSEDGEEVGRAPFDFGEAQPDDPGSAEIVIDDANLTINLGPDWELADENLTPILAEPGEVFSAGTGPLLAGGEDCATVPEAAIEAMAPDDALVSIQEEGGETEGFPERPQRFVWMDGRQTIFQDCIDGDATLRAFRFQDVGRGFYAYVAIGSEASSERIAEAVEILDNLVVCDEKSPPDDCA